MNLAKRIVCRFNFQSLCERCCDAIKLKLDVYCFQRNYLLKKSINTLRFCGKLFSTTVALFTNASRNRVNVEI